MTGQDFACPLEQDAEGFLIPTLPFNWTLKGFTGALQAPCALVLYASTRPGDPCGIELLRVALCDGACPLPQAVPMNGRQSRALLSRALLAGESIEAVGVMIYDGLPPEFGDDLGAYGRALLGWSQ